MFRPHFGICICHGLKRLIVVKKGYCHEGNRDQKNKDRKRSGINSEQKKRNDAHKSSSSGLVVQRSYSRSKKKSVAVLPIQKKRKPIQYRRKRTGELEVFKEIIEERGPHSQISKAFLGQSDEGLNPSWFSHILSKGAYPRFRKYKKNIILKTPKEHDDWENRRHKLKDKPEWKWIFDLEQELKREYYEQNKQPNFNI